MSTPTRSEFREGLAELVSDGRLLVDELTEQWQRKAQVRRLKGREVQELPDADEQRPMRETVRLRSKPATVAGYTALTVFAATAVLTAPAASAWQPWAQLDQAVGHPITSQDAFATWLIHQAASPLLAVLLWLGGYAAWLSAARDITVAARRGRYAWATRIRLGGLTVAGAALTHHLLDQAGGPVHPLLAAGVVIAAWRTLAWTTTRQADAVDTLNDFVARSRFPQFDSNRAAKPGLHPIAD